MTNDNTNVQARQPTPKPNPALKHLDVLVGDWNVKISFPANPSAIIRGHVSFEWLEGGAFLAMHSDIEPAGPPNSIAVISRDDSIEIYYMLYFDSRGVSRIYEMHLSDGV